MNKNLLKLGVVIALSMMSASAYAAATSVVSTVIGGGSFAPSNKVKLWASATTSAYNVVSGHLQGDRVLGSGNSSPNIIYKTKSTGTDTVVGDCPDAGSAFPTTGWSTL